MVSKVESRLMQTRFRLNGADKVKSSFAFCKQIIVVAVGEVCLPLSESNRMQEKTADAHSPMNIPTQEAASGNGACCFVEIMYKI